MKRITDILKKFPQYESIPYAGDYKCPGYGNSGIACGSKFRFHPHLNKFDFDDFNETVEIHYLGENEFSCVANSEILDKELTEANTPTNLTSPSVKSFPDK